MYSWRRQEVHWNPKRGFRVMYIGGTVISSVEFHGNMSLVIFMSKCPLACRYCHNVELLEDNTEWSFDKIKEEIDFSADFLDAVVISGGEPLLQVDAVIEILTYVRQIGLKTKLDTSGIYPDNLKKILDLDLLDYVSLDVKTTFPKYKKITGANVGFNVKKSMNLINESGVHLEIRTTYVPTLHTKKDIYHLVDEIQADVYTIQQFRNKNVLDPNLEKVRVPNPHDLENLAREIKPYFDGIVKIKSAEFGEQVINWGVSCLFYHFQVTILMLSLVKKLELYVKHGKHLLKSETGFIVTGI